MMTAQLTNDAQAILLLTAPLLDRTRRERDNPLTPREYSRLTELLGSSGLRPADILTSSEKDLRELIGDVLEHNRILQLRERGLLLSERLEAWRAVGIRVVTRADLAYPARVKTRLRGDSPAVLYIFGSDQQAEHPGVAIVGSRNADTAALEFASNTAASLAGARQTVVSGGARGIDRAAMDGALHQGGYVIGVMSHGLEEAALRASDRSYFQRGLLTVVSPFDPLAGFHVGNAMQRNKLIYAYANAGLVVETDKEKGGTWSGAVEQLRRGAIPIYVRGVTPPSPGLQALSERGARVWSMPSTPDEYDALYADPASPNLPETGQLALFLDGPSSTAAVCENDTAAYLTEVGSTVEENGSISQKLDDPAQESPSAQEARTVRLWKLVHRLLSELARDQRLTVAAVSRELGINKSQAKIWLQRFQREASEENDQDAVSIDSE